MWNVACMKYYVIPWSIILEMTTILAECSKIRPRCRHHVAHSEIIFPCFPLSSIECPPQMKTFILAVTVASAAAFAPIANQRSFSTALNLEMGRFDGKLWDNEAKKEVYAAWNPSAPRSVDNFNPFETWDGNSPDCSGRYPGETGYKDPARGDINFAQMMIERQEIEERSTLGIRVSVWMCRSRAHCRFFLHAILFFSLSLIRC